MTLFGWLRKINGKQSQGGNFSRRSQRVTTSRPRLEELEDRVTPTAFDTVTNVAITITPNFLSRTAIETITATVTNNDVGGPTPNAGNVNFLLNNKSVIGVPVNSSGQATTNINLPLYAVAGSQTINVFYEGTVSGTDTFNASVFLSPVYLNTMNAVFPSTITFVGPPLSQGSLPVSPFGTYNGETDTVSLFGLAVKFNYIDPGTIDTFNILGFTLPGSLSGSVFAAVENAVVQASTQLL
jgi:hypothetical protein